MPEFINVADLPDPDHPGKTYRESNAEKTHRIPLGALVELENGVRMFVVKQGRDCDQTPLYWLAWQKLDPRDEKDGQFMMHFRRRWIGGYPEESLNWIQRSMADEQGDPRIGDILENK